MLHWAADVELAEGAEKREKLKERKDEDAVSLKDVAEENLVVKLKKKH